MGQKTHPTGFRVGIIQPWTSTWYAKIKDYKEFVAEDAKIRKYLKKKLYTAGISKILIERKAQSTTITLVTAKPGIIVGRGGQGIEDLKKDVTNFLGRPVVLNVVEVARIDVDAQLVSESIAQQLEKRVAFRRAMKQSMQRTMRAGAQGIKVMVSGRLGGAEIARSEWAKEGRIPLQTLRADVDYGFAEADTMMGKIGVKVWVYKGSLMPGEKADANIKAKSDKGGFSAAPRGDRPERGERTGRGKRKAIETE